MSEELKPGELSVVSEPKPEEKVEPKKDVIPMSERVGIAVQNHAQLLSLCKTLIKAGAVPKHLKDEFQVLAAWNYAAQLGLPPQPSLRNIAVINGSPSLFGDLPLALCQRHKEFIYYEEFIIDKEYNKINFENKNLNAEIFGGVVIFERKDMGRQSFSFTVEDARRAGVFGKNVWVTYPQVMIIRRARISGIRAMFADALSGASIAEDLGYAPDLIDVTPQTDKADLLNNTYGAKDVSKEIPVQIPKEPGLHQNV